MIAVSATAMFTGLPVLGSADSLAWLALGLFGLGVASGVFDVAMNVAGVVVERAKRRPVMPLLHAGFSFGALAGAAAASLAAAQAWSPVRHFVVVAVVGILLVAVVVRALPGVTPAAAPARRTPPPRHLGPAPVPTSARALLRRPVLWLLATVALCSAIAEGASSDWSALLLVTEQGASEGAAALAYAGFSLAMALTRLGGSWAQARFGAARVLGAGAAVAAFGLVTAALIGVPWVSYAGFVLAGTGLAASFPVALGLAAEVGKRADDSGGEREVAFVTAIAYTGFLAGPPMTGGIAHVTSLSVSFVVVGLIAAVIAPAAVAASRRLAGAGASRRTSDTLR